MQLEDRPVGQFIVVVTLNGKKNFMGGVGVTFVEVAAEFHLKLSHSISTPSHSVTGMQIYESRLCYIHTCYTLKHIQKLS